MKKQLIGMASALLLLPFGIQPTSGQEISIGPDAGYTVFRILEEMQLDTQGRTLRNAFPIEKDPKYGRIQWVSGMTPDPLRVRVYAGGLSSFDCNDENDRRTSYYFAQAPDLKVDVKSQAGLKVLMKTNEKAALARAHDDLADDVTLDTLPGLSSDKEWFELSFSLTKYFTCGGFGPSTSMPLKSTGTFSLWVGMDSAGNYPPVDVILTERDASFFDQPGWEAQVTDYVPPPAAPPVADNTPPPPPDNDTVYNIGVGADPEPDDDPVYNIGVGSDPEPAGDPVFNIGVGGDREPADNGGDQTFVISMAGDDEELDAGITAAVSDNHCGPDEKVWFNANVAASSNVVSVCGSESPEGANAWLDYRYGKLGDVELKFPEQVSGSLGQFIIRRYTRPRTTYLKFEFTNGDYNYAILENFEADFDPASSASLRVTRLSDGKEVAMQDLEVTTKELAIMALETHVPTEPYDE